MMLQDIKNGHGIFFIDPHGDGIDKLINSGQNHDRLKNDLILLDPEDVTHSFGINILACRDLTDWSELNRTYKNARWLFYKLFEKAYGEKPWLELFFQNILFAFIENQECSLAEIPMFLEPDKAEFRQHIIGNMKRNLPVADFWRAEFSRPEREQRERADAALTRFNLLLGLPLVRDIVSQRHATINFAEVMEKRRILLVRLSAHISPDIKKFIGTMLVNELVRAATERAINNSSQFCIFIDEFQNFASMDDFAVLFTQAGKYGIATTIAHHERRGQFADNPLILGATDQAGNKILFQQAPQDAKEDAVEFARPSPTETRWERKLVISQTPFSDLLHGHAEAQIREFVNKNLRPHHERLEDIQDEIKYERLIRDTYHIAASEARIEERLAILRGRAPHDRFVDPSVHHEIDEALLRQLEALKYARVQTEKLLELHLEALHNKEIIRGFNRFFTAIMEGRLTKGQEAFSSFLWEFVSQSPLVRRMGADVVELLIGLWYGDVGASRSVPVSLANKYHIWQPGFIREQVDEEYGRRKQGFKQKVIELADKVKQKYLQEREEDVRLMKTHVYKALSHWEPSLTIDDLLDYQNNGIQTLYEVLQRPPIRNVLEPYFSARIAPPWYYSYRDVALKQNYEWCKAGEESSLFIQRYGEGAVLTLKLLLFGTGYLGTKSKPNSGFWTECLYAADGWKYYRPTEMGGKPYPRLAFSILYPNLHMRQIPPIVGKEPLEVFLLIMQLKELVAKHAPDAISYGQSTVNLDLGKRADACRLKSALQDERLKKIYPPPRLWASLDEVTSTYLIARACDIVRFGEIVAGWTFPQPTIYGSSVTQVAGVVDWLIELLEHRERIDQAMRDHDWDITRESWADEAAEEKYEDIKMVRYKEDHCPYHNRIGYPSNCAPLPSRMPPRVLNSSETKAVEAACLNELNQSEEGRKALATIDEFVQFCEQLRMPENHIKVFSGQYTDKQVNTYSTNEMAAQMAQELMRLPPHTAYVKMIQEVKGKQSVAISKIRTLPPPFPAKGVGEGREYEALFTAIRRNCLLYCKERVYVEAQLRQRRIDVELRLRREQTLKPTLGGSPPKEVKGKGRRAAPSRRSALTKGGPPQRHS
jgi:hypothetical protein